MQPFEDTVQKPQPVSALHAKSMSGFVLGYTLSSNLI